MRGAQRPLLGGGELLDGVFGLERGGLVVERQHQGHAFGRVEAGIACALAGGVGGVAAGDVGGDAGVEAAAAAFQHVEKPAHVATLSGEYPRYASVAGRCWPPAGGRNGNARRRAGRWRACGLVRYSVP